MSTSQGMKRVGFAQRTLDRLRERRAEVKIIITKEAAGLMNTLFRVQDLLPIKDAGIAEHYKLNDEIGGRDIVKIQRWIRTTLLSDERKNTSGQVYYDLIEFRGTLKQKYVDRINVVLDHYKKIAQLPAWMDVYYALKDGLEGKEPLSDNDLDVEEAEDTV